MFLFMVAEINRDDGSGVSSGDGSSSDGSSSDGSSGDGSSSDGNSGDGSSSDGRSDGGSGYVDMGSSSSNSGDYSSGSESYDNEAPDSLIPYEMEKEAPAGYDSETGTVSNNITISLPPALFKNLTETSVGLLYTYYSNSSLFPVRRINDSEYPAIATPVIGASLVEIPSVVNLSEPIIMTLPLMVVSQCSFLYQRMCITALYNYVYK